MTDTSDAGTDQQPTDQQPTGQQPTDQLTEPPLEVVLDTDECVSAGKCVNAAPGFFVFDADEIGSVDPTGRRPSDQVLLRIARQCPSGAIRLRRDGVDVEI